MNKSRKNQRRIIASLLTGVFMLQQTMTLSVIATDITGVTGNNGVYNIDPTNVNGTTGFRQYTNFNLSEGDIANLLYNNGIDTFVNLVDNRIRIDGIVNTLRNNGFYNGKAIFISPNGMVVGASGVLNVGSLGVYTPTDNAYKRIKGDQTESGLATLKNQGGNNLIQIDGKVFSAGDVELVGKRVDINQGAGVFAGLNKDAMSALSSHDQANALFNEIVNTDNMNTGNKFASDQDGHIVIKSTQVYKDASYTTPADSSYTGEGGTSIGGVVRNYSTGKNSTTEIHNTIGSTGGIDITGEVSNAKGYLYINSNSGSVHLGENGVLKNNGVTQIGTKIGGNDKTGAEVNIEGKIITTGDDTVGKSVVGLPGISDFDASQGTLQIRNDGQGGLKISGDIDHKGDMLVYNGHTDLPAGKTGNQTNGIYVTGNVNATGNATFTNTSYGQNGLNFTENATVNAKDLTLNNEGAAGTFIDSKARLNATRDLNINDNSKGGTRVQGIAKANRDVNIDQKGGGNVVIGDATENDYYVNADRDINIKIVDGSLLNYGVEKVLLAADGDLTMDVTNGTIGLPVGDEACADGNCTGISPTAIGS